MELQFQEAVHNTMEIIRQEKEGESGEVVNSLNVEESWGEAKNWASWPASYFSHFQEEW